MGELGFSFLLPSCWTVFLLVKYLPRYCISQTKVKCVYQCNHVFSNYTNENQILHYIMKKWHNWGYLYTDTARH